MVSQIVIVYLIIGFIVLISFRKNFNKSIETYKQETLNQGKMPAQGKIAKILIGGSIVVFWPIPLYGRLKASKK